MLQCKICNIVQQAINSCTWNQFNLVWKSNTRLPQGMPWNRAIIWRRIVTKTWTSHFTEVCYFHLKSIAIRLHFKPKLFLRESHTVSFKTIIRYENVIHFRFFCENVLYELPDDDMSQNRIGYVFEKIEIFNFPCYFPFKIYNRVSIGSKKIINIWLSQYNFTPNVILLLENFF